MRGSTTIGGVIAALALLTSGCSNAPGGSSASDSDAVARYKQAEQLGQERLKTFDTLDFDVYSNQQWGRLGESHATDILVHYPDGSTTRGLPDHIAKISQTFVFAPDTKIKTHPIKIVSASGEWTSVIGVMEGTFTKPMPGPNGTTIQPTGKAFKLQMVTVGHWKGKVMDEEYLFYDNQAFMKQIGLAK